MKPRRRKTDPRQPAPEKAPLTSPPGADPLDFTDFDFTEMVFDFVDDRFTRAAAVAVELYLERRGKRGAK